MARMHVSYQIVNHSAKLFPVFAPSKTQSTIEGFLGKHVKIISSVSFLAMESK